ncbi:isoprenylcysteine carboxylmethyltransferase family protein [Methylomonas sp. MO1]|uniref:methyltransferase family protein n=1 Tax=Methylomonas sp. MO1 TaxID=3073619 RepID=UPI0028A43C94|nr:isoprenylcysteine carboxylmethyltransferase family protein [Methylomonas sp. MO1]MDT4290898.1 isoprenylcysteine carboxylmethyltransferase family protein [Methylomonas sp. MO1]
MTSVRILWLMLCLIWMAAEIMLARRTAVHAGSILSTERRSQRVLWISILISLGLALWFKNLALAPIKLEYLPRQAMAMALFAAGLYLRYTAVMQLGRFFTTNVAIQQEHRLIKEGPYRWLRHPAYTGLLIALFAAGVAMGDFVALATLLVPTIWAFSRRIEIEERMLLAEFGSVYAEFCQSTWRLLPWVY